MKKSRRKEDKNQVSQKHGKQFSPANKNIPIHGILKSRNVEIDPGIWTQENDESFYSDAHSKHHKAYSPKGHIVRFNNQVIVISYKSGESGGLISNSLATLGKEQEQQERNSEFRKAHAQYQSSRYLLP